MTKPYKSIEDRNKSENRRPDEKLTAAQFKRKFMNKKAIGKAEKAVAVRSNLGTMKNVSKDKARLRSTWENRGENVGSYHNPSNMNGSVFSSAKLSSHIRTTI